VNRRPLVALAASAAWLAAFACAAAACGGRVDASNSFGPSGSSGTSGTSGGVTDAPPRRPGGGKGRPPVAPLTNAAVGSMIAEDYCKTFSSCCFADGQPPIDVARCRELTSAAIEKELDAAGTTESSAVDVAVCVGAIHTRIAACSKDDIRWHSADLPIFAPGTVATACHAILPDVAIPSVERCSESMSCQVPSDVCAIDQCSAASQVGLACDTAECFDASNCIAGKCMPASLADVGAACTSDVDCRIGLVCFAQACAPTRDHPELAKQRSSPYRIGADTCRAFTYL